MSFHSDQALDLEDESSIAIFSCYEYPERAIPPRKLVVESKEPCASPFEIPLTNHSLIVFSLDTNRRFKHKIVLDKSVPLAREPMARDYLSNVQDLCAVSQGTDLL
jgi:hypothetical protein